MSAGDNVKVGHLLWACVASLAATYAATLAAAPTSLSATTLDGGRFSLAAERGRVVVVNFWATWCAPCRAEMPALDTYYRAHQSEGLEMLAISLDAEGSTAKITKATASFRFRVTRIADTHLPRSAIPRALPETWIFGRDGSLRFVSAAKKGQVLDAATIERVVSPLLDERATR